MKNILKFSFVFTLLLTMCISSFAQMQTDAPVYQNLTIPMCHDDGAGNLTSYTVFQTIRLGDDAPCITKTLAADGTEFTVPATGTIAEGYCQTPDPTPDCELVTYCDGGVTFFRVFQMVKTITPTGFTTDVTVIDINEAGAIYTASGNEVKGECILCVESTAVVTPSNSTATGTIAAMDFTNVTIVNCGCANGTITIGGSTVPLYVGQSYEYNEYKNPITGEWELNPLVAYDATGTEFCIITTSK